jgi:hypothetical protein
VDGFYAASILKELHPDAYQLLSTVRVPAHAAGEKEAFYMPSPSVGYPVLGHTNDELVQIRWNNDDRSVIKNLEPGMVESWYVSLTHLSGDLHCGLSLFRLNFITDYIDRFQIGTTPLGNGTSV